MRYASYWCASFVFMLLSCASATAQFYTPSPDGAISPNEYNRVGHCSVEQRFQYRTRLRSQ